MQRRGLVRRGAWEKLTRDLSDLGGYPARYSGDRADRSPDWIEGFRNQGCPRDVPHLRRKDGEKRGKGRRGREQEDEEWMKARAEGTASCVQP